MDWHMVEYLKKSCTRNWGHSEPTLPQILQLAPWYAVLRGGCEGPVQIWAHDSLLMIAIHIHWYPSGTKIQQWVEGLYTAEIQSSNHLLSDERCLNVQRNTGFKKQSSDKQATTQTITKSLFTSTLGLELRKKLVKCYIWSIALCGAETWMLRAVDQKHLESFEMWCWRRMEKISWTDHVRNEDVLLRV